MSRPRLLRTETVKWRSARILRKPIDDGVRRTLERNARRRIQRNQIDLRFHAREQSREPARVVGRIVDAGEHHVLERDPAALAWSGNRLHASMMSATPYFG